MSIQYILNQIFFQLFNIEEHLLKWIELLEIYYF